MNPVKAFVLFTFGLFSLNTAVADETLSLTKIANNIYAIVGELSNRSPENLGNNANTGFVVTSEGVVLIDTGGTYKGARKIHQMIKKVTNKPIVTVINSGGQDHRWLGNGYFKEQGAQVIASKKAVADHKKRGQNQLIRLAELVGEKGVDGTAPVYADITFDQSYRFEKGGVKFEIIHAGQAHTPGDSFVWLPETRIVFSGDIVYTERMLGVGSMSNSKSWLEALRTMAGYQPDIVVPGHGRPTDLKRAIADSMDYLMFLRKSVSEFMDAGGDITEISKVDQSKFHYLLNHESLAGRNAQQVYTEMEWE